MFTGILSSDTSAEPLPAARACQLARASTANSRWCHAHVHAFEVADMNKLAGGCYVPAFGYIEGYPQVSGCRCIGRQVSSDISVAGS